MPMALEQLKNQLSAIEANERTFDGIGSSEVPLLAQLLQDEEGWMASRAVFALSRVPDGSASTILRGAVADSRPEVRVALAASAGRLNPEDANNILLTLLTDSVPGVRQFAIQSVAGDHDDAVHAKLRDLGARDPALFIRNDASDKLRELNL